MTNEISRIQIYFPPADTNYGSRVHAVTGISVSLSRVLIPIKVAFCLNLTCDPIYHALIPITMAFCSNLTCAAMSTKFKMGTINSGK